MLLVIFMMVAFAMQISAKKNNEQREQIRAAEHAIRDQERLRMAQRRIEYERERDSLAAERKKWDAANRAYRDSLQHRTDCALRKARGTESLAC